MGQALSTPPPPCQPSLHIHTCLAEGPAFLLGLPQVRCLARLVMLGWVSPVVPRAFWAGVRARLGQAHLSRTPSPSL